MEDIILGEYTHGPILIHYDQSVDPHGGHQIDGRLNTAVAANRVHRPGFFIQKGVHFHQAAPG